MTQRESFWTKDTVSFYCDLYCDIDHQICIAVLVAVNMLDKSFHCNSKVLAWWNALCTCVNCPMEVPHVGWIKGNKIELNLTLFSGTLVSLLFTVVKCETENLWSELHILKKEKNIPPPPQKKKKKMCGTYLHWYLLDLESVGDREWQRSVYSVSSHN